MCKLSTYYIQEGASLVAQTVKHIHLLCTGLLRDVLRCSCTKSITKKMMLLTDVSVQDTLLIPNVPECVLCNQLIIYSHCII